MRVKPTRAFEFSSRERVSFWVLICILTCSLASIIWMHSRDSEVVILYEKEIPVLPVVDPQPEDISEPLTAPVDPNKANLNTLRRAGLSGKVASNIMRYREKGGSFRSLKDMEKIYGMTEEMLDKASTWFVFPDAKPRTPENRSGVGEPDERMNAVQPAERFLFDPNTLDREGWIRLGVPEKAATNVIRYREKGGLFRKPEDIGKIYGMPDQLAAELQPYIQIEAQPARADEKLHSEVSAVALNGNTDLNVADAATLIDCGINKNTAWDIINYRDRLGGFYTASQLLEIKQLDSLDWQLLSSCVFIDAKQIRTMSINTAGYAELANHPYLSDRLARAIIQYRDSTGRYRSTDEMARAYRMSPAYLEKLKFYLRL